MTHRPLRQLRPSGLPRAGRLATVLVTATALAVGCGGGEGSAGHDGPPPAGDAVVVAEGTSFTPDALQLPVGRDVTVVVDNRDRGVAHNIRFPKAPGNPKTRLENGPTYQTLTVRFDAPGTYDYVCDLHPTMRGKAEVG